MYEARPDGEGNQAAVFCRIPCSGDQKNAEDQIDTADHLQIVAALATMPDPTRRPHETKRIDQQEGDSGNDKRKFQIALSNLVHHVLHRFWNNRVQIKIAVAASATTRPVHTPPALQPR